MFFLNHSRAILNPMNEKELVSRARAGDFDAFTELINAHKDRLYGLALKLSGNRQDAEDILQETFLKAIDKIDQFREEATFGTWLYSIALNQARGHYTRQKQDDLKPLEEYLPAGDHHADHAAAEHTLFNWEDPHTIMESAELSEIIQRLISELPYKYREAFLLRYIEELPVKEVARLINETEAAAKSRILRARLALREELAKIFEGTNEREMPGLH